MHPAISRTDLPLPLERRGKVRDVYRLGSELLLVATDRVSAFDVVMPQPVPGKGEVLNLLSAWWFARIADIVPTQFITVDPDKIIRRHPGLADSVDVWARRSSLVLRTEPFPVECVVRGYISGSAWREYSASGTLASEPLPVGLRESDKLDEPIFSPATKAEEGHDENITFGQMCDVLGTETATRLRDLSLSIYETARDVAAERGIILADTKFEFGRDADGEIRLIDEAMTPDSSRFWPADAYEPGRGQDSLDKQPLRDFLDTLVESGKWDRQPPGPDLPTDVIHRTAERYVDVFHRLTGLTLDAVDLKSWGRRR